MAIELVACFDRRNPLETKIRHSTRPILKKHISSRVLLLNSIKVNIQKELSRDKKVQSRGLLEVIGRKVFQLRKEIDTCVVAEGCHLERPSTYSNPGLVGGYAKLI
jgi:hypothetical protein